ncbi:aspartyl/glutamyl-tRNA(Asn/Gln) amidotransferase subunit C [Desulfofundulus australicus DSM 11792]|uniref:Aspartyl/glutamyl-tRNA(Asn/Gln) amidotransferase subunit C n=1 Tax=Desulfofundulus australicus DSM 11792 TaxID=1121425 RepID=A0A1M5AQT8_9FIRM|nr:Asp-tRNA(Asn)/Glu-tRNA(Gln) amidotransferase subunit GatC [Desulfofundulus australicus]SHF32545.1 aspartyl/glutamyl-tRNA(Asn/Gln) amidotransferase subunit C [Desulfofundulus australicus DSM 11792]
MITIKDVEHVALLARLELSEEEKQMYTKQLDAILEYAQVLNELDTDDVPPTAHVLHLRNVWREDEVGEHLPPDEVLANAPETEGQFFKVPRIV